MAKTIFVQIASYRDPDCRVTIDNLYRNAKYPENIYVGVVWQFHEADDFEPFDTNAEYAERVRMEKHHCTLSLGVCWARHQTQKLYANETYTMQIDSHMRFIKEWDVALISMYEQLKKGGVEKPVISHYPPSFTPDGEFDDWQGRMGPYIREDGIVYFKLTGYRIEQKETPPLPTAFMAGGFFFADAECIREIPYDPYLYFHGEEITLSARFWTHGWDIFNPSHIVCHHLFKKKVDKVSGKKVPVREIKVHRDDNPDHKRLDRRSVTRIRHLLGSEASSDPEAIRHLDTFGLGKRRSLVQYENYAGLDFKHLSRDHYARVGLFFQENRPLDDAGISTPPGINLPNISVQVFKKFGIETVVQLGVDSPGTLARILGGVFQYAGITADPEIARACCFWHRREEGTVFYAQDYLKEALPSSDLVVCLNLFERLPTETSWQLLKNISRSGSRYLLATHSSDGFNLNKAPFYFPDPMLLLQAEGKRDVFASLFRLDDLRLYLHGMDEKHSKKRALILSTVREEMKTVLNVLQDQKPILKQILYLMHTNISSKKARELYESSGVVEKLQNGQAKKAMDTIFRLRYWSSFERIRERFAYIEEDDMLFVIALMSEFVRECEAKL